jgi:hypothetical protein
VLDDLQWKTLLKQFRNGNCVPFLGAGVNIANEQRKYHGLPLGQAVADALGGELGTKADLARAALEYEVRVDRPALVEFLEDQLPDAKLEPSPALRVLARLPLKLVVTTNYDRLLERALEDVDYVSLVQPAAGFEDTPEMRARLDELIHCKRTIVYKIHGTFAADAALRARYVVDHEPGVIITEDDYIRFLGTFQSEQGRLGVPRAIKKLLTPSTLLFLGYSLQDWDFRAIHESLIGQLEKQQARRSYAVQLNPANYWVSYWIDRKVQIVDGDIYEFCDELEQRYFELYPEGS